MSARVIKFLVFAIILASTVSYLFFLNPANVEFHYAKDRIWTGPLALLEIITFFVGIIVTLLFCFPSIIRNQLSIASLKREINRHENALETLQQVRELFALGEFTQARTLAHKIIDANPQGKLRIDATSLLARTYLELGQTHKAQEVLDGARNLKNVGADILLLSAEVNSRLGNHTAAYDSCHAIVSIYPKSTKALKRIVAESKKINRIDTAISYQSQLLRLLSGAEHNLEQDVLAELELSKIEAAHLIPSLPKRLAIEELLRRHREFAAAESALAACEAALGETEVATRILTKLFARTGDATHIIALGKIWLAIQNPQRAITVINQALSDKSISADSLLEGKLVLIHLFLHLEMHDEAEKLIKELPAQFLRSNKDVEMLLTLETLTRNRKFEDAALTAINYLRSKTALTSFETLPEEQPNGKEPFPSSQNNSVYASA